MIRSSPIVLLLALLHACADPSASESPSPSPTASYDPTTLGSYDLFDNKGRYQLVAGNEALYRIDSATGKTWVLTKANPGSQVWLPMSEPGK